MEQYCMQINNYHFRFRQQYAFDISTNKGSNRVYLFAAENAGERNMWMQSLSKVLRTHMLIGFLSKGYY